MHQINPDDLIRFRVRQVGLHYDMGHEVLRHIPLPLTSPIASRIGTRHLSSSYVRSESTGPAISTFCAPPQSCTGGVRSEERRVGKEGGSRWGARHERGMSSS